MKKTCLCLFIFLIIMIGCTLDPNDNIQTEEINVIADMSEEEYMYLSQHYPERFILKEEVCFYYLECDPYPTSGPTPVPGPTPQSTPQITNGVYIFQLNEYDKLIHILDMDILEIDKQANTFKAMVYVNESRGPFQCVPPHQRTCVHEYTFACRKINENTTICGLWEIHKCWCI